MNVVGNFKQLVNLPRQLKTEIETYAISRSSRKRPKSSDMTLGFAARTFQEQDVLGKSRRLL